MLSRVDFRNLNVAVFKFGTKNEDRNNQRSVKNLIDQLQTCLFETWTNMNGNALRAVLYKEQEGNFGKITLMNNCSIEKSYNWLFFQLISFCHYSLCKIHTKQPEHD